MLFIKAYVGAFYLEKGISSSDALTDAPPAGPALFSRDSGGRFCNRHHGNDQKNVSYSRFRALQPEIAQLNALYKDVKPGDEYRATYIPGIGTELALNGTVLGVVPGAEYSAAFFSIWIGKNPIDKGFRNNLLGK
ncbi:MAG: chalcone isomerase family protein [Desulfobacterales bacterium]